MLPADNLSKKFGPRSGPTNPRADGFNLSDIQMVFLKEFFKKNDFEKNSRRQKKHDKFSRITSPIGTVKQMFFLLLFF